MHKGTKPLRFMVYRGPDKKIVEGEAAYNSAIEAGWFDTPQVELSSHALTTNDNLPAGKAKSADNSDDALKKMESIVLNLENQVKELINEKDELEAKLRIITRDRDGLVAELQDHEEAKATPKAGAKKKVVRKNASAGK